MKFINYLLGGNKKERDKRNKAREKFDKVESELTQIRDFFNRLIETTGAKSISELNLESDSLRDWIRLRQDDEKELAKKLTIIKSDLWILEAQRNDVRLPDRDDMAMWTTIPDAEDKLILSESGCRYIKNAIRQERRENWSIIAGIGGLIVAVLALVVSIIALLVDK